MRRALVIGAGGHCRVLLSLLAARGDHEVTGILDLAEPRADEIIMGIPVFDSVTGLEAYRGRVDLDIFLAIGDNEKDGPAGNWPMTLTSRFPA